MGQPSLRNRADAIAAYDNGYYQDNLEMGLEFQDFMADALWDEGMAVVSYVSKKRGRSAENKMGIEMKCDRKFRKTGNLYIETAEKSHPQNTNFVPSGIYRDDNSWLYAIGDEKKIWIFGKTMLRYLHQAMKCKGCDDIMSKRHENCPSCGGEVVPRYVFKEIPTSQGFVIPLKEADRHCEKFITPKGNSQESP